MITFFNSYLLRLKKIILIVFCILSLYRAGFCEGEIYFNYDFAVFKGDAGNSILEIYYSVNQQSLRYTKTGNNYEAAAKIDIMITDVRDGKLIYSNVYKTPSVVSDTSRDSNKQKLVGQINYIIPPGGYKIEISGTDFNDTLKKDVFEKEIITGDDSDKRISISDIELSTMIKKSDNTKSIFYKNTLEIIPNPSNLFGMNLNEMYYYFEIYNLIPENISGEFDINYRIKNLNNEIVINHHKRGKSYSESKADYGKIKIDSLKRGSYFFEVSVTDSAKGINVVKEKKFFIFNNATGNVSTNQENSFLKSEYGMMTEKELDEEFEKMTYIVNDQQRKRYESLSDAADKRKFLYAFWKAMDQNTTTPVLKAKQDYFKKVDNANKMFNEAYTEGWKTDRGRIFIVYGPPDEREVHPFQSATKSYERWTYNTIQGGGECDFIELQPMTGVFWLVNSTFRTELKNPNWMSQLEGN